MISQMTRGITAKVTCRVMCGIAGLVTRSVTGTEACRAPDRMPYETMDEGLREVTSETTLRAMHEIAFPTKD